MRQTLKRCCRGPRKWALAAALLLPSSLFGQISSQVLKPAPIAKISAKAGSTVTLPMELQLANGYHVNSNTPSDPYFIPLTMKWDEGVLRVKAVKFPAPFHEKFAFSDKPLSVFKEDFKVTTTLEVPANTAAGDVVLSGKVRYQACSDKACLPPRTITVSATVQVTP